MFSITRRRRQHLCHRLLADVGATVGFVDVGSGGPLKRPWNMLPGSLLRKLDFEPTQRGDGQLPLCVSNRHGTAQFHIARDERASSCHRPMPAVVTRFGLQHICPTRTIDVECTTLDGYLEGRFDSIDALDINAEGHDYQVLQGGARLLEVGSVKLLKIEFEVAPVWEGQGWLSDIDPLLRGYGYCLAGIDFDFVRPVNVRHCFHRGEPLWGKALYVPGVDRWSVMLERLRADRVAMEQTVAKAAALFIAADVPGQAVDVLEMGARVGALSRLDPSRMKALIASAYRWAKLEYGVTEVAWLAARALRLTGVRSEA